MNTALPTDLFFTQASVAQLRSYLQNSSIIIEHSAEQSRPEDESDLKSNHQLSTVSPIIRDQDASTDSESDDSGSDTDSQRAFQIIDAVRPSNGRRSNLTFSSHTSWSETESNSDICDERSLKDGTDRTSSVPSPTTIHLQSSGVRNLPRLFLFPDGSGSAASYSQLPFLEELHAITAFSSPLMAMATDDPPSLPMVVRAYVAEILKIQPSGPYNLGGWSIGGTYAYEAGHQLLALGKTVARLILIDSPCPQTVPPLPCETIEMLESAGLFGSASASSGPLARRKQVRRHFRTSLKLLASYRPTPMLDREDVPTCHVIWARHGVAEPGQLASVLPSIDVNALDAAQRWLLLWRRDFGANGWDQLVPKVVCDVVEGNHFSIMQKPQVRSVARAKCDYC